MNGYGYVTDVDLPDGYAVRKLPRSGKFVVYNGPGAQMVRPAQDTLEEAVDLAFAHSEGIPVTTDEPEPAKDPDPDPGDDIEEAIAKRVEELQTMKADEVRVVAERYGLKYQSKTKAVDDIINVEFPVEDDD